MTSDGMTGAQISYNSLNLPERIVAGTEEVRYIYSAAGEKLATVGTDGSLTYYRSVFTYAGNQLQYVLHPEGLVAREGDAWTYRYFKTDHVGSVRALLAARDGEMVVEQRTDYYPTGLAHGSLGNLHLSKYLYGGKEYQDGLGLGWYDFHARYYNPLLGRWFNQDPALQTTNPYLYSGNSPLMYVDPDGEFAWAPIIVAALWMGANNVTANEDNIDNFWQGLGYFGIGAAAGAAGAIAGGAVAGLVSSAFTSVATTGAQFIGRGIVVGAAGGFAGGFAGGATGAWFSGASFTQGLEAGLKNGGFGALTGGVIGGLNGAITYYQTRNNFLATYPNAQMHTRIERTDKALREFSDKYFADYKYNGKTLLSHDQNLKTSGGTSRKTLGGKYVIRFGEGAFRNDFSMYITMGHEYVHVAHYINVSNFTNALSEAAAYEYTLKLLDINSGNYDIDKVREIQRGFFNKAGISGANEIPAIYKRYESWGLPIGYPVGIVH